MKYILFLFFLFGMSSSLWAGATTLEDYGTLTTDQYDTLTHGATYGGSLGKNITIFEYSDLECPFCIRHHTETLPIIVKNHTQEVNFVFKNNVGVRHAGTEKKGIAVLCARQYGGARAYYQAIHAILNHKATNNAVFPISRLGSILQRYMPIRERTNFSQCISHKLTQSQFLEETQEAEYLGLTGTPGFVVVNHATKEYVRIIGAYPYDTFRDAIDKVSE